MHTETVLQLQHSHAFDQHLESKSEQRTLIVLGLTIVTMVIEIGAGLLYGSMALLADGLHMSSHVAAMAIAIFAYVYTRKRAHDNRFSFGTGKVNSLAGFASAIVLGGVALVMIWESAVRLLNPQPIGFTPSLIVAVIGLIVNALSAFILIPPQDDHADEHAHHDHSHGHHHHHHHDHNLRAVYLHVIADALTSVLAIGALLGAKYAGWMWLDPAIGFVGAALILRWSWGLVRDSAQVLLDHQVTADKIDAAREAIEKGTDDRVTDLHIWSIAPGTLAGTVALLTDTPQDPAIYKAKIAQSLKIAHITVEVNLCPNHHEPKTHNLHN